MLRSKSLTQLRGIAQSYGIPDIFKKDHTQLIQAIELKQQGLVPEAKVEIPRPEYDARLMTKPPSKKSDRQQIEELLQGHIERGLHITFTHEGWSMSCGKKNDSGTLRMPLSVVLNCANKVLS